MRVTLDSLRNGPVAIQPDLFVYTPPRLDHYDDENPVTSIIDEATFNSPSVPHAGFGYSILEGGFIERAIQAYRLHRLAYVRQLGFLEDPDTPPQHEPLQHRFMHTRFLHSLDVAVLAALIVYNNQTFFEANPGFDKVTILAALTHDVLTPAGGDTTKSIDYIAFDEDRWYSEVLKRNEVAAFLEEERIDIELLPATVRGDGVCGSVLDFADKLAYTIRDTINFEGSRDTYVVPWDWHSPSRAELSPWTSNGIWAALWQNVLIDEGGVIITSPHDLYSFLKTRALMFRNLYTHPRARHHESLVARTLLSFLYDTGQLSRDWLLDETDEGLRHHLSSLLPDTLLNQLGQYYATYQTFTSMKEAKAFETTLVRTGNIFVQAEDVSGFFKPGTHFRIQTKTGVQPFSESALELSRDIAFTGKAMDPVRVYYIEGEQPCVTEDLRQRLRGWRLGKLDKA